MREAAREEGSDLLSLSLSSTLSVVRCGFYYDQDPVKGNNFLTSGLPGLIAAVQERHRFAPRGRGTCTRRQPDRSRDF